MEGGPVYTATTPWREGLRVGKKLQWVVARMRWRGLGREFVSHVLGGIMRPVVEVMLLLPMAPPPPVLVLLGSVAEVGRWEFALREEEEEEEEEEGGGSCAAAATPAGAEGGRGGLPPPPRRGVGATSRMRWCT